ncbi:NADAR domain-containing protein [Nonomuraea muscovyensis]
MHVGRDAERDVTVGGHPPRRLVLCHATRPYPPPTGANDPGRLPPGEAKKLGRLVRGFDEATWAEHRYGIVVRAGVAKFAAHPELRDYLLGTETWKGLNLLGFALMDARDELSAH